MLPVLLFELEGVLADTAAARRAALAQSFADEQLTFHDDECAEVCAGRTVRSAVVAALGELGVERDVVAIDLLTLRAERHFAARLAKGISLVNGARELLDALGGRTTLGIVTRAARPEVDFVLGLAGLEAAFGCIVSAEDCVDPKPSPAPYHMALARLARRNLDTTGALAIEDGLDGIRSAHAAGLGCIAVGDLPAHHAIEADGYLPLLADLTAAGLDELAARIRTRVA